ncbi:hypothetical protein M8R20_18330 [Pseudomonas sp. R2.Fl]|nr:hypothetical protein [Pseudomonas sp. R2.Fl]
MNSEDEADRAARVIIDCYGERSIEYACELELAAADTEFAKAVRVRVEQLRQTADEDRLKKLNG